MIAVTATQITNCYGFPISGTHDPLLSGLSSLPLGVFVAIKWFQIKCSLAMFVCRSPTKGMQFFPLHLCVLTVASINGYSEAQVWPSIQSTWLLARHNVFFGVHLCCAWWCNGNQSCPAVSTDALCSFAASWNIFLYCQGCVSMIALILSRTTTTL